MVLVRVILAVLTLPLLAAAWTDDHRPEDSADVAEIVLLRVDRMNCDGCPGRVKKVAERLPGVLAVDVESRKGHVEVIFDPSEASAEGLARGLSERTGFRVRVVPAGQ